MTVSTDTLPPIVEKWIDYKKSKIKQYPCNNLRASSVGHPCMRYLYHSINDWKQKELHDYVRQSIFDEGNDQEKVVLRDLRAMGFEIVENQRAFQLEKPLITGSIDGILRYQGKDFPFDIKTISPNLFDKMNSFEDFLQSKYAYHRNYVVQLQCYMLMSGNDTGCLILKQKVTGEWKVVWMEFDAIMLDEVLKRAQIVYDSLAKNTPPERVNDIDICASCDFNHICLPDVKIGEGVVVVDDAEMIELLERRETLKPSSEEYDIIDEKVKKTFKATGLGEKICGNFLIKISSYAKTTKIPLTWDEQKEDVIVAKIAKISEAK